MTSCVWAEGRRGQLIYSNPLPKDPNCIFHSSTSRRSGKKRAGFHQKWQSLGREEQGCFHSVQSGLQAHSHKHTHTHTHTHTHWLINTGREREGPASIDRSCIGCRPCQRRIITHSHCPLPQLPWVKVKAKVINNAKTLFLPLFEAAGREVKRPL